MLRGALAHPTSVTQGPAATAYLPAAGTILQLRLTVHQADPPLLPLPLWSLLL